MPPNYNNLDQSPPIVFALGALAVAVLTGGLDLLASPMPQACPQTVEVVRYLALPTPEPIRSGMADWPLTERLSPYVAEEAPKLICPSSPAPEASEELPRRHYRRHYRRRW